VFEQLLVCHLIAAYTFMETRRVPFFWLISSTSSLLTVVSTHFFVKRSVTVPETFRVFYKSLRFGSTPPNLVLCDGSDQFRGPCWYESLASVPGERYCYPHVSN